MFIRESVQVGGTELSIETGRMAKQANGAVVIRYGDTMVLVTAVSAEDARDIVAYLRHPIAPGTPGDAAAAGAR